MIIRNQELSSFIIHYYILLHKDIIIDNFIGENCTKHEKIPLKNLKIAQQKSKVYYNSNCCA